MISLLIGPWTLSLIFFLFFLFVLLVSLVSHFYYIWFRNDFVWHLFYVFCPHVCVRNSSLVCFVDFFCLLVLYFWETLWNLLLQKSVSHEQDSVFYFHYSWYYCVDRFRLLENLVCLVHHKGMLHSVTMTFDTMSWYYVQSCHYMCLFHYLFAMQFFQKCIVRVGIIFPLLQLLSVFCIFK